MCPAHKGVPRGLQHDRLLEDAAGQQTTEGGGSTACGLSKIEEYRSGAMEPAGRKGLIRKGRSKESFQQDGPE